MRAVTLIILMALLIESNAQQVKTFHDELGVKGEIRYSAGYNDSILPKQGTVDIRWREMRGNDIATYVIKGQTREHLPNGKWIWEEATWNYTVRVGESIAPLFQSKAKRMKWEGNFVNGLPDGKWLFVLDSITGNKKSFVSLMKFDVIYKAGVPTGAFNYESNGYKLKGMLDSDGVATGTWIYTYKSLNGVSVKEERVYKKGLLIDVSITEGTVMSITKRFENNARFADSAGDAQFYQRQQVGTERFQQDEYYSVASNVFYDGIQNAFLKGWKLDAFPYQFKLEIPAFKKLEFPLFENEKKDIADAHQLIDRQRASIEEHLSGNIYIHRSRSGTLDTAISYLQLKLTRLNYIDSLLRRTELPHFTYKNRHEQGVHHWISGLNDIRFSKGEVYDSLSVELPKVDYPTDTSHVFSTIKKLLQSSERVLPEYFQIVENAQTSLKREGELNALEDRMLERYMALQTDYAELKGIGEEINTKWLKSDVQHLIQTYAQTDDYDSALQIASDIMSRLDSIQSWKSKLDIFDKMPEVLRAQYTNMAYNPYTGNNDIEITVKKRFIQNVLTQMWPYMRNELSAQNDWNQWVELWNRQFDVYHYLLAFASKEDKHAIRLNKRVRKEDKPEKMLRLILNEMSHE